MAKEETQAPEENAEDLDTQEIPDGTKVGKVDNSKLDAWNDTDEEVEDAEETEEADETADATDEEVEEYEPPAPIEPVANPGAFNPTDYSFIVTNAEGKKTKISTPEEADVYLEDEDNFETTKQSIEFMRKVSRMENGLEKDKAEYDKQLADYRKADEELKARDTSIQNIESGINYLVEKKLLPAVDKSLSKADWNDPNVATNPGIKEQRALLNYMVKESETRVKAGLPPITSVIDAFNAMQLDNARNTRQSNKDKNAEERKTKGARIASTTSTVTTPAPKGIAIGRTNAFTNNSQWDD